MDKQAIIKALRDTAQSASNSVAETASLPIDAITWALRKAGLPVPENAVGSSEWMAQKGLTVPVDAGIPKMAGEVLGNVIPAIGIAKAPQIASAMNKGAANMAAPTTLNKQTGAIVWHGSPHKFDKFDSSKIGTGEGAQAYGHGLYLAESKDVADMYRKTLTQTDDFVDGQLLDSTNPRHFLARVLSDESGNIEAARESLEMFARPGGSKSVAQSARQALDFLANGERPVLQTVKPDGSLYKVDLPDEQIAKMLDWDKPLSQQTPEVLKKVKQLERFGTSVTDANRASRFVSPDSYGDMSGAGAVGVLQKKLGDKGASDFLKAQGIPGIRYLDGGSRGTGSGTSNFVVFPGNEDILKILERNGQPLGLMGVK